MTLFLSKIVLSQNHVLLLYHLVYKMTKYVFNIYLFSLMFSNMIHAYEKFQKMYLASGKFKSS